MRDRRIIEFDRLNLVGKVIYSGGLIVAATGKAIDAAVEQASRLIDDAERAFREGLGDDVEDARILSEEESRTRDRLK